MSDERLPLGLGRRSDRDAIAEDLAIFNPLFFRTKDLLDVERMVAFLGPDFDRSYVRRWLIDLVGSDDVRVARWDALLAALPDG